MLTILELIRPIQTVNIQKSDKRISESISIKTCGQMSKSEFGRKDRSNDDDSPDYDEDGFQLKDGDDKPNNDDDDDGVPQKDGDDAPNN